MSRICGSSVKELLRESLPLLKPHFFHLDLDRDPVGAKIFASARRPSSSLSCLTSATWTSVTCEAHDAQGYAITRCQPCCPPQDRPLPS